MKTLRIGSLQKIESGTHKEKVVKIIGRYHNGIETCYICLSDEPTNVSLDMIRENRDNVVIGKLCQEADMIDTYPESCFRIHFTEEEKALVGTTQVIIKNDVSTIPAGTRVEIVGLVNERALDGCPLYLVKWKNGYSLKHCTKVICHMKETSEDEKVWMIYGRYLTKGASNE